MTESRSSSPDSSSLDSSSLDSSSPDWRALRAAPWLGALDRQLGTLLATMAAEFPDWVASATALASRAAGAGQVYLDLHQDPGIGQPWPTVERWRQRLTASLLVGGPGSGRPLILDAAGRLYLGRFHRYQESLATDLQRRAALLPRRFNQTRLQRTLDRLDASASSFASVSPRVLGTVALCRVCVVQSVASSWSDLIAGLVAVLTEQLGRRLQVLLSGPQGQRERLVALLGQVAGESALSAGERSLLPREPLDIDTLPREQGAVGESPPLQTDLLVVAGAEAMDLVTLARLVRLLAPYTRLVLLGDNRQAPRGRRLPFATLLAGPGQSQRFCERLAMILGEPQSGGAEPHGPLQEAVVSPLAMAVDPSDGLYQAFWVDQRLGRRA